MKVMFVALFFVAMATIVAQDPREVSMQAPRQDLRQVTRQEARQNKREFLQQVSGDFLLNATVSFNKGLASKGTISVVFDGAIAPSKAEARYVFNITHTQPWLQLHRQDGAGKTAVFVPNGPLAQNIR